MVSLRWRCSRKAWVRCGWWGGRGCAGTSERVAIGWSSVRPQRSFANASLPKSSCLTAPSIAPQSGPEGSAGQAGAGAPPNERYRCLCGGPWGERGVGGVRIQSGRGGAGESGGEGGSRGGGRTTGAQPWPYPARYSGRTPFPTLSAASALAPAAMICAPFS